MKWLKIRKTEFHKGLYFFFRKLLQTKLKSIDIRITKQPSLLLLWPIANPLQWLSPQLAQVKPGFKVSLQSTTVKRNKK